MARTARDRRNQPPHRGRTTDEDEDEDGQPGEDDGDPSDPLDELFVWAAIDPDTEQIVHVAVTQGRGGVEALGLLKGVLARCDNKPTVHVDRGVWYPWP